MHITDTYPASFAVLVGTLDNLADADLTSETPCTGLDARRPAGPHRRPAARVRLRSAWRDELSDWHVDKATADSAAALDDVRRSAFRSVADISAAIANQRVVPLAEFHRTVPATTAAGMQVVDNLAHAWDISRARRREFTIDDELVALALAITEKIPTDPAGRGPEFSFGPALEASDRPPFDRFLALLGRDPAWVAPPGLSSSR